MTARYEELVVVLEDCVTRARTSRLTLGDAVVRLGDASYSFIAVMLCLPFVVPLSLGPAASAGGLALAGLGWQLLRGRPTPWLPERVRRTALPEKVWVALLRACLLFFRFGRKLTRPRLKRWVTGTTGARIGGATLISGGLLMAIPMAGVPLNNTFPALMMLFACLAELEQDGAMLLVAAFWGTVTVSYFALVVWLVFVAGVGVLDWMKGLL